MQTNLRRDGEYLPVIRRPDESGYKLCCWDSWNFFHSFSGVVEGLSLALTSQRCQLARLLDDFDSFLFYRKYLMQYISKTI